ncbi:MAG: ABC transporter ATP-binding protein/permease [Rickettsiales bacterium]|jgi:ATP-binding cassette subfamily B protein|nr:ABC transporter ATP-binding protein/permease [Rickettsiales bacterium]
MSKTLLGFYWEMLKEHKWYSIGLCLLGIISRVIGISFYPFVIERIYSVFDYKGPDFWNYVINIMLIVGGLQLGRRLIQYARTIFENKLRPQIRTQIKTKIESRVRGADYKFFLDKNVGTLQSQQGKIYDNFHLLTIRLVSALLGTLLGIGLIFGMLQQIDIIVAIIILANAVIIVMWDILIMKKSARLSADSSKAAAAVNGTISDSILNFTNVKVFAGEKYELEYTKKARAEAVKKEWRFSRFTITNNFMSWFVDVMIAWLGTILYCIWLFHHGEINVAGFALVIAAFGRFEQGFDEIGQIIKETVEGYADASQAWKEIMVSRKIADKENAKPICITRGAIELRGISFRYHSDWVVRDLSIKIRPGEKVGIVGTSGAGKTTLSHLILRLFDVQKGAILIDGQNIKNVTQNSLRSQIAFVPQDPALFNRTFAENIAYARPDAGRDEIENAAKSANIHDFIIGTEKGYDTIVGNRGIKLSGGQRQRVAIARAILKNSPVLILDEATSALDSETEQSIQKSFGELMKKRTTIVIAHRLSTLRKMDRIIVMETGAIVEQGSHDELLKKGGIYAKLWKMQSGGFV